VVIVLVGLAMGKDMTGLLSLLSEGGGGGLPAGQSTPGPVSAEDAQLADFVSVALADTEDTWGPLFRAMGRAYVPPRLVLFSDSVDSACGLTSAAVGPFYCPGDNQVYMDLSFFRDLRTRFGAPGDFAVAYVIAHEIGHHVQNQLGISGELRRRRAGLGEAERNALSVRQELQADCFAGVWGHHAGRRSLLEAGDVDEGLNAAAAIGDDRLQRQARGYVSPESFTHGASEQRARWLRVGLSTGDVQQCNTIDAPSL